MSFKITLEAARVNKGLTQKELAKIMGKDPSTIINWEKGRSNMTLTDFQKLCNVLEVPMEFILLPTISS